MKVYVVTETWNGDIGTEVLAVYSIHAEASRFFYNRQDGYGDDATDYELQLHEIEVTE